MLKVLVPVDGSDASQRAIDHLVGTPQYGGTAEIHVINVQPPLPYGSRASSAIGHDSIEDYHREEAMKALRPALQRLDAAGVKYQYHIVVGEPAKLIVQYAKDNGIDQIVMGTHGRGAVASVLMGSVAKEVLTCTSVPVVLVK
jgi:nucleotide-binding universal stress UspA family protein